MGVGGKSFILYLEFTLNAKVSKAMNFPDINVEHAEIRSGVAQVCRQFPGAYWRECDAKREYPEAFVSALSKEGYLAAMIPEGFGGSGLNLSAAAVILEEIHRQGCNAAACHAQMYTMGTVLRHGSPDQKKRYLPGIAGGSLRLQAFGVTEPTSGTDTLALKTTAMRDGDHYIINGQKIWTSRAAQSDLMLLLARTTPRDQIEKKTDGLSVFLLDLRELAGRGVTIRPIRAMINHSSTEVFFDQVSIPASSLIGEEGKGFKYILSGMNAERILIAAECIGDAKWFLEKASTYAKERVVFGAPIGRNQGVQFPLAKAFAHTLAAEAIVYRAAGLYDQGQDPGVEANTAKMLAADASWEAAEACLQTHGGFGFAEEYDVERKFRETRLYQVAPISTNLILCFLAERVLGLPKSY
jgi:acyl-CoA dehydrogenase